MSERNGRQRQRASGQKAAEEGDESEW